MTDTMTDATTRAREVDVTQADMEAANHAVRLAKKRLARMGGRGSLDPVFFYKAFARHRIAAEQTAALADAPGERGDATSDYDDQPQDDDTFDAAPTEPTAATRTSGGAGREAIARAICVAMGDDPEREGPFAEWFAESPYATAADAILAFQPDHFAGAGNMIDREAVEAEAYEKAESAFRIAIWNEAKSRGVNDDLAYAMIKRMLADPAIRNLGPR